jgi:hypothetical protein
MKRYFEQAIEKQVVMIEFASNSVVKAMSVQGLFGDHIEGVYEISKREYIRRAQYYKEHNTTNMVMTISR